MTTLEISASDGTNRTITLHKAKTTIGRGPENDVTLDDSKVSRRHAQIEVNEDRCLILDLKSRNGTFLDETRLLPGVPELWSAGKVVHIGSHELRLSLRPAQDERMTQFAAEDAPSARAEHEPSNPNSAVVQESTIQVTVEPIVISTEISAITTAKVTAINLGQRVEHLFVTVDGIPAAWQIGTRPVIELFPGTKATALVTLQPQLSPQVRLGPLPVNFRVYSEDGQAQATCAATLIMTGQAQPVGLYDLTIFPTERSGVQQGAFQIQLANRGQSDLALTLSAADVDQLCHYTVEQTQVNLSAGQERTIRLLVQANKLLPGRTQRPILFTVVAEHAEWPQLTRRAHGAWLQIPPAFDIALDAHTRNGTLRGVYQAQVGNQSDVPLTLQLAAKDLDGKLKFDLSSSEINVPAGEDRTVELMVQPLKALTGPDLVAFPFVLSAHPTGTPQLIQRVEGVWQRVAPSFEVVLTPAIVAHPRRAEFQLAICNQSPGSFVAQLAVASTQRGCTFTLAKEQVKVAKAMTTTTLVTGKARGVVILQNRVHFPFTVTVYAVQNPDEPQTISGEYRQTRHWGWVGWLVLSLALVYFLFVFFADVRM